MPPFHYPSTSGLRLLPALWNTRLCGKRTWKSLATPSPALPLEGGEGGLGHWALSRAAEPSTESEQAWHFQPRVLSPSTSKSGAALPASVLACHGFHCQGDGARAGLVVRVQLSCGNKASF